MESNSLELKSARKTYSAIGLALTVVLLVATALQAVWFYLPGEDSWFVSSSTGFWLGSFLPLYLVAMPLGLWILKRLPRQTPADQKLSPGAFLGLIPMCFCVMYAGNILGNFLSSLLSGGTAENAVIDYAMDSNPIKVLFLVILAPLFEEFLCRKMVIDSTRCYGEKTAAFLSALVFGLMHQNLFQFFYAFALGYVFACVYLRTGRLRYTVILHGIINFMGSVAAPFILSKVDMEAMGNLDPSTTAEELMAFYNQVLPGLLMLLGYALILMGLSVTGLVLLLLKRKNMVWLPAERQLSPKDGIAAYWNVGLVIFILLCLGSCVLALM